MKIRLLPRHRDAVCKNDSFKTKSNFRMRKTSRSFHLVIFGQLLVQDLMFIIHQTHVRHFSKFKKRSINIFTFSLNVSKRMHFCPTFYSVPSNSKMLGRELICISAPLKCVHLQASKTVWEHLKANSKI